LTIIDAAPAVHPPGARALHWSPTFRMKFYAVLTLLAAVAVLAAALCINSMGAYHARVQEIARVSERALLGEQLDKLVIATVMESRGIYMARDRAEAENFIPPLLQDLADLRRTTGRWMGLFPAEKPGEATETAKKIDEFVAFRSELVRLAREVGLPQAREFGDNEANRENRKALNRLLTDMVARSSAEIPQLNDALAAARKFRSSTTRSPSPIAAACSG
jgi:methyl-accepting chemotaxis protein